MASVILRGVPLREVGRELVRLYPKPKRRIRWLTPDQARVLLSGLPEHQRDLVVFAVTTGLRQTNDLKLEWSEVDLERGVAWIHANQAEARRSFHVSLSTLAKDVLVRQVGKHPERVFTFKGRPINSVTAKAWRAALDRAGIENFRWHDLRHTWASWHVQNGTPLYVVQEMGACETASMVRRAAHLAPAHLAAHAEVS